MAHAIELRGVEKAFGSVRALQGLTLQVPEGVIYGLLGPNGSGKSTAIRSIAGLLRPDAGTVTVLGRPAGSPGVIEQMAYMPQTAAVYEELSVESNVRFFASLMTRDVDASVSRAIELVDLVARKDDAVHTLSGGLKQRVSLACALAHSPRVLLLDEPTVGGDPELRATFWQAFRALADGGATLLVSSHVMDEAARCDRLGLIRAGRLLREGTDQSLQAETGTRTLEDAYLALAREAHVPT